MTFRMSCPITFPGMESSGTSPVLHDLSKMMECGLAMMERGLATLSTSCGQKSKVIYPISLPENLLVSCLFLRMVVDGEAPWEQGEQQPRALRPCRVSSRPPKAPALSPALPPSPLPSRSLSAREIQCLITASPVALGRAAVTGGFCPGSSPVGGLQPIPWRPGTQPVTATAPGCFLGSTVSQEAFRRQREASLGTPEQFQSLHTV
ncbi:uncharacterized protein LOC134138094 [Rhea pennata]|uniref:uncharacterized protein LOC134138094 n=1 Tax=Rhea pennata TaxID=8795 RepID=UPI002E262B8F